MTRPKKINRKLLAILVISAVLSFFVIGIFGGPKKSIQAANYTGLGEIRFSWSREIYDGVELTHIMSYNNNQDQKTYTITFNPKTVNLQPIIAFGGNAMYGSTMTSLIDYEESQGHHVVFGVNGDAYDTSNGVATGIVISNGELITSSSASLGFGILADGTIKYGSAALRMVATLADGTKINLTHVNKERKQNTTGVYLLTDKFNDVTASTEAGVEVIFDVIDEHKDQGLRIGKTYSGTVKEVVLVQSNPNKNQTKIGKNQFVLATHQNSPYYQTLKNLKVGTKVDINVDDVSDDRIDWSEVVVGMGIFHLLMENGEPTSTAINDPAVHPRTSMGIKADGTIVLMQNDGRQYGWANGLTFMEMVEYMKSLGVVTLFNFDGGGSSTIQATLPGNDRAQILNKPSDGNERANTNALLFIAKEEKVEDNPVEKLHIYPKINGNFATKALILENSIMQFEVKATDRYYYKVPLDTSKVTYSIENEAGSNIGTITQDGTFKATSGTGKGRIVASYGDLKAYFDIEVVNKLTLIETDLTILSIAPGKQIKLNLRSYYENVPVVMSNESLTFELDPPTLGTVASDGTFTAANTSATGEIIISYKDFSFSLPVEVGRQPVMILDFEEDIFSKGWNKYYTNIPANGGSGNISINTDERFVKHGDQSLRIDYDFATKPLTGTVALEIGKNGNYVLEGQPTAIGAWVYGDGNGGWFRIQMTGGKYVGDTIIDWVGWKYIETPIPKDAPYPYTLQRVVRLLGTASIANNKKGTIYVDSVRAIYDFKNDDNDEPVVDETTITPAPNSTVTNNQQPISLKVKDKTGEGIVYTGINTARTKMYINNKEVTNIQQNINPDGSVDISYIPSALELLRPGIQNVKVRVEDNFGNKKFIEWSFTLEGYAPTVTETPPGDSIIYAGQEFEYKILTPGYKDFSAFELELSYNKNNLILQDVIVDSRLVITNEVNNQDGKYILRVIGMQDTSYNANIDFITLKFKVKETVSGTTAITIDKAIVYDKGTPYEVVLNGYDVEVDYKYNLSIRGSTVSGNTIMQVVFEGNPVADVSFIVYKENESFPFTLKTNANGIVTTDIFGKYPIDTKFRIRAIKDGFVSNEVTITIVPSLGSTTPDRIVVTVGEDAATSVGISFITNHDVKSAKVLIATNASLTNATSYEATSQIIQTSLNTLEREYTAWGAFITNLQPNTKYYYKVGSDEYGWSDVKSFKTAKASGNTIIAVFGDIQGGFANFANTVKTAYNKYTDIDLNIIAGDIVDAGNIYSQWVDLYSNSKEYFANNIWTAAIGNHDTNDDGKAFASFFYGPTNGIASGVGARNYYYEINNAIIFNFDTEAAFNSYDPDYAKQISLLKDVMAKSEKMFKIVVMHRSAYPVNYNEENVRELAKVFEEADIDLVISGHDHVYHRTTMYQGAKINSSKGITYIVTGTSSGAKYYDGDPSRPWADFIYDDNNPVFNFLKFEDNKLIFEAYAIEASGIRKFDEVTIEKNKVDLTITTGGKVIGSKYLRDGQTAKYRIEIDEGYILETVKLNGQKLEVTNNEFIISNFKSTDKLEVTFKELTLPYASDIKIEGKLLAGLNVTVSYKYNNAKGDSEQGTVIEWYVANTKVGEGKTLEIKKDWVGKQLEVRITAKSTKETGIEVSYTATEVIGLLYDINQDGSVTKEDAMLLLQVLTYKEELTEEIKYFANLSSNTVTLKDVRNILAAIGGN